MAGRRQKIPWEKIRNEYITAFPKRTYRELAAKYEVSFRQLGTRGAREKWVQRRKEYCNKIATKSLQKTAEQIAEEIAEMNVRHATTGRELLVAGRSRMRDLLTKARELRGLLAEEDLPTGQALRAIELGVKIERLARGEATEIEEQRIRPTSVQEMTDEELERIAGEGGISEEGARQAPAD